MLRFPNLSPVNLSAKATLLYLCICIVYLHVRDLWTLLFRSWYHFLFKNIALVGSICKFDQTVFVYLCICVFVFSYLVSWRHELSENVWVEGTLRLEYGKSGIYNNNRLPAEEKEEEKEKEKSLSISLRAPFWEAET